MAGYLYALALYVLGFWLAYEANLRGLRCAVWLAGAQMDVRHHSRLVRWPDGVLPFHRVLLLYVAGLLGTISLMLGLAILMGLGFLIRTGLSYPFESMDMVVTMFGTWLHRAVDLAGIPFERTYWAGGGVFWPTAKAMIGQAYSIDGVGGFIFIIAYELGTVASLYLAISALPLLGITPVGRAVGQWMYAWGNDPFLYGWRWLCQRTIVVACGLILLVESGVIPTAV